MRQQLITLAHFSFDGSRSDSNSHASYGDPEAHGILLKKTVMICEDDLDLARVYIFALRSKYEVVSVNSGRDCIEKYEAMKREGKAVHVLLLDYRLPDMDGDRIAARIKDLDGTKIILISAFEIYEPLVDQLKKDGTISLFVRKPITIKRAWASY